MSVETPKECSSTNIATYPKAYNVFAVVCGTVM